MVSKFILVPLVILLAVSVFSYVFEADLNRSYIGYGRVNFDQRGNYAGTNASYVEWYDMGGHGLVYYNGSFVGEAGVVQLKSAGGVSVRLWFNESSKWIELYDYPTLDGHGTVGSYDASTGFPVYKTEGGSAEGVVGGGFGELSKDFFAGGSLGFIAIIAVVMFGASFVGVRLIGSGVSETSVSALIKGGAFTALFVVCGVGSWRLYSIPFFGGLIYFFLSLVYVVGVIDSFGHGSND